MTTTFVRCICRHGRLWFLFSSEGARVWWLVYWCLVSVTIEQMWFMSIHIKENKSSWCYVSMCCFFLSFLFCFVTVCACVCVYIINLVLVTEWSDLVLVTKWIDLVLVTMICPGSGDRVIWPGSRDWLIWPGSGDGMIWPGFGDGMIWPGSGWNWGEVLFWKHVKCELLT